MPRMERSGAVSRSSYLNFGRDEPATYVDASGALEFLKRQGFGTGDLAQARSALDAHEHERVNFSAFATGYCDFCFMELMGGEYELLGDGRERCTRCSRTVIASEEAFRKEFESARRNMEVAFGISLATPIVVRMVNAREIARRTGESFVATGEVDPRVLGFVESEGPVQSLYIENGSPRLAAITTMVHELTHVWQNKNWNHAAVEARVGKQNFLAVVEGMAVWAQVQYLLYVREFSYAMRQLAYAMLREDEYGVGFRVFAQVYPLQEDNRFDGDSPFKKKIPL